MQGQRAQEVQGRDTEPCERATQVDGDDGGGAQIDLCSPAAVRQQTDREGVASTGVDEGKEVTWTLLVRDKRRRV